MPYVRPSSISTTAIIQKGLVEHIDYSSDQRQEEISNNAIDVLNYDNRLENKDTAPDPQCAPSPSFPSANHLNHLDRQFQVSHSTITPIPAIGNPSKPSSIPSTNPLSSRSISRRFTTTDLTPPMPVSSANLLASNFAGLGLGAGHSDTVVTRLKDAVEEETIPLQNGQHDAAGSDLAIKTLGMVGNQNQGDRATGIASDKPLLPPSLPSATTPSATPSTSLPHIDTNHSQSRRESDDLSVPDLVSSGISSTSLDTMHDTPSPIVPDQDDRVVVIGGAGEGEGEEVEVDGMDPKLVAINKYREGLYTYTRGLWLEAKSSSLRTDKRPASMSAGTGTSGSFGHKQSGMERLAAKKALARRLNA